MLYVSVLLVNDETPNIGFSLPDIMAILLIVAGAMAIHFPLIGDLPLRGADEVRDRQIVKEMIEANDLTTPRLEGAIYPDKPPLYYWAAAA